METLDNQLKERFPKEYKIIEKEREKERKELHNLISRAIEINIHKLEYVLQNKFRIDPGSVIQQFENSKIDIPIEIKDKAKVIIKIFFPGFKKGGSGIVVDTKHNDREVSYCLVFSKSELQFIKVMKENDEYIYYYKFIRPQLVNNPQNTKGLKAIIIEGKDKVVNNKVCKIKVLRWAYNKKSILVEVIE